MSNVGPWSAKDHEAKRGLTHKLWGLRVYQGVDVSNHQRHIDWRLVRDAGIARVVAKASEGTTYDDEYYRANATACADVGLPFGGYCFGRPSAGTGRDDAEFYLAMVQHGPLPCRHFLDLEDDRVRPDADLGAYCLDWCQTVERETLKPVGIYTSPSYARAHKLHLTPELGSYDLWVAAWQSVLPQSFAPWQTWLGWQFTFAGYVPGIGDSLCDLWKEGWGPM